MITEGIINIFIAPILWLLDILPAVNFSVDFNGISSSISALLDLIYKVACIVPVNHFMWALIFWVAITNFDIIFQLIMFVVRKIPGIN